jgi:hypothetical protein
MQQLVFFSFKGLTKNGFKIQMTFAPYKFFCKNYNWVHKGQKGSFLKEYISSFQQ